MACGYSGPQLGEPWSRCRWWACPVIQRKSVSLYVPGPLNLRTFLFLLGKKQIHCYFLNWPPTHTYTLYHACTVGFVIRNSWWERIKARQSRAVFVLERILIHWKVVTTEVLNHDKELISFCPLRHLIFQKWTALTFLQQGLLMTTMSLLLTGVPASSGITSPLLITAAPLFLF